MNEFWKNKGVDILYIREISREMSRLKSFHCVFKFDNDQFGFRTKNVSFSKINLNQKVMERLASFDACNFQSARDV